MIANRNNHPIIGCTVRIVMLNDHDNTTGVFLALHKEETVLQRNGRNINIPEHYGFIGGGQTEGENDFDTIQREGAEETEDENGMYLNLLPEFFMEGQSFFSPLAPSKRPGVDWKQDRFYFLPKEKMPPNLSFGKIKSNHSEIVRIDWFPLSDMPTPDSKLPFGRNQLHGFVMLLQNLSNQQVPDADRWLKSVTSWAYLYLL